MSICKLCLQDKLLIKSHIIPEFMYKDLYDSNNKFFSFSPFERLRNEGHIKRQPSGEYDCGILCKECDNKIIGRYEDYGRRFLYGGKFPKGEVPTFRLFKDHQGLHFTNCSNVSYKRFKLFLLSILWRASISSRPFFHDILLGEHDEILRKMLLEDNAGNVEDYPFLIFTWINDKSMHNDIVAHPQTRQTKDGTFTYVFMIGGNIYLFFIHSPKQDISSAILTQTIQRTNELNIFHLPPGTGMDVIFGFYGLKEKPSR